jgi:hypothetical protein
MKTISQNPERYSKQGSSWVISASPAITPTYLSIGVPLQNLKPVIKANGIVVKVGESYLCSLQTFNDIKLSQNPHYDIVQNGTLKVKDKEVIIGKTIKIIELNVDNLNTVISNRDTLNKNAGVLDVVYSTETKDIDGVPKGIIDQINYTLDEVSQRPMDEYSIFDFYRMVDYVNNPNASHYKITPLLVQTQQADTIFDPKKLREYLIEVQDKLKLLEIDFNLIQDIFYEAKLPTNSLSFTDITQAQPDAESNDNHTVRRYNRSKGIIQDNILSETKRQLNKDLTDIRSKIETETQVLEAQLELAQASDRNEQANLTLKIKELQTALANKKDK